MGAGGLVLLVLGVLVGGVMVWKPRALWWAFESWKFRNPEANEPSDAAYMMTRLSGVGLVVLSVVLGVALMRDGRTEQEEQRAAEEQAAADAAFVPPSPEVRALLPVVGAFAESGGNVAEVFFQVPENAFSERIRSSQSSSSTRLFTVPCYYKPVVTDAPDGRTLVNVELIWQPQKRADAAKSDACRLGGDRKTEKQFVRSPAGSPPPIVLTDAAIVTASGTEVTPAAPGNPVPALPQPAV
ncbi:hypothetical protein FHR72_002741 [Mycolicibacterium iranicum]|uniref:DUF6199 domain-containing protein n=1 Tax=Mycolicibacterium iranicum TaxID=912594 RepID=A0A839Q6H2_MYCIR|nr:DUF6199 family natural product biosynthesis protein [Mycolicibacterium iranicum]MBB2991257.1 hypothetical protein [Mycolicibacterium iranicum]